MKAIQVKWLSATESKGTRIKAFAEGGNSVTLPRDYGLSDTQQDASAAYQRLIN